TKSPVRIKFRRFLPFCFPLTGHSSSDDAFQMNRCGSTTTQEWYTSHSISQHFDLFEVSYTWNGLGRTISARESARLSGSSSAVERQLPKLDVAGSIPVSRSINSNTCKGSRFFCVFSCVQNVV